MEQNSNNNKKTTRFFSKRSVTIIIVGCSLVLLFVLLQNLKGVGAVFSRFAAILTPFFWGIAIAYMLNLLLKPIEKYVFGWIKKRPKLRRALSVFLTLVVALLAIAGLLFMLIPQLIQSISLLGQNLSGYLASTAEWLTALADRLGLGHDFIENTIGSWESLSTTVMKWLRDRIPDILDYSVRLGRGVVVGVMGVIVSVYILFDKERLLRHVSLVSRAVFPEKTYGRLHDIAARSHRAFGGFLAGKTLDSLIIGVLCFIFMAITKMPYSLLISTIIGVTNIIPTFGPIIGGVPCTLIIMIVDPMQGLWFGVFIILLQQFDGNILGPFILSDTVGLSALWILVSVVVCGALFGVIGMVIGVPLFAVLYDLIAEYLKKRLVKKGVGKKDPDDPAPPGELVIEDSQRGLKKVQRPSLRRASQKPKSEGDSVSLNMDEIDKNVEAVEHTPLFRVFRRREKPDCGDGDTSAEPSDPKTPKKPG